MQVIKYVIISKFIIAYIKRCIKLETTVTYWMEWNDQNSLLKLVSLGTNFEMNGINQKRRNSNWQNRGNLYIWSETKNLNMRIEYFLFRFYIQSSENYFILTTVIHQISQGLFYFKSMQYIVFKRRNRKPIVLWMIRACHIKIKKKL